MEEKIPFTDFGGTGRKIVFLHGNGFPPESYSLLLTELAKNYHVIAMHSRTMWQKEVPLDLLSWRIFAQDITRFLDEYSLHDAILLGHSFGGLSALRTMQDHPRFNNPLVMIDPVMVSPQRLLKIWWMIFRKQNTKSSLLKVGALRRKRIFTDHEEAFRSYKGKPIFAKFSDIQLKAFIKGLLVKHKDKFHLLISPEWEAKVYETAIYKDVDIFLKLPFFRKSALIIWGTESDTLRSDAIKFLHFINKKFLVEPVDGASHLLPFEQPELTAKIIHQYILEQS